MVVNFDKLPLLASAPIVVAGGGVAGCAAAIAAGRMGAQVVLLESSGMLGGLGTLGCGAMFAPRSDGFRDLSQGIGSEIIAEMCRRMKQQNHCDWLPINTEVLKKILDELILAAGVKVFFEQKVIDVEYSGTRIQSLALSGIGGIKKVTGSVFLDCTGDAALSAAAGAECWAGDEVNGELMSPTLGVQYTNVDFERYRACGKDARIFWLELAEKNLAPLPERHFVGLFQSGPNTGNGNLGHIYNVNTLNEEDLSRAYMEGRRIAEIYLDFYRKHVPGFEEAELSGTAGLLGIRETRRVRGDYYMTLDDFESRRSFPDEIGRYNYPVDIHASSTSALEQANVEKRLLATFMKKGESYGIPYRALCVAGFDNLLIAGRITSSDRPIQSSLRVMPGCFITGQAAGTAAALAAENCGNIRNFPVKILQQRLAELIAGCGDAK